MKKCCALFLILAIAVSVCGCGKNTSASKITPVYEVSDPSDKGQLLSGSELIVAASNENFELSVIPDKGYFEIKALKDGYIYSSAPKDILGKSGETQSFNEAMSVIAVEYGDKINRIKSSALSYTDCVLKGGQRMYAEKNCLTVFYDFSDIGITVPLRLTLLDDGIYAEVLTGKIEEKNNYLVTGIELLEYFAAGANTDEGYIVVPDGSGAVIEFNNNKHSYPELSIPIYGNDASLSEEDNDTAKAYMPIFGIKNGEHGVLSIIDKGDAAASVKAGVSGSADTYNRVYASFTVRDSALVSVGTTSVGYSNKTFIIFDENEQAMNAVSVKYILLSPEQSDYSSMARIYGDTFNSKNIKNDIKSSLLYLNMVCSVKTPHNVLGVEYEKTVPTATFEDITEIVAKLSEKGVLSPAVRLEAWNKSDIKNKLSKSGAPASQVGSDEELKKLSDKVSKLSGAVYGGIDMFHISSSDNYSARQINKKKVLIYPISKNTLKYDKREESIELLSPAKLSETFLKLLEKMPECSMGLSLGTRKDFLYSDFGENYSKRQQSVEYIRKIYATAAEKGYGLGDVAPPSYAVEYLNSAFWLGGEYIGYDVEDYSIPFYQLAVSEMLGYSGEPINQAVDEKTVFMKTLEYGGGVMYNLITDNIDQIAVSDNTALYNCEADKQLENMLSAYNEAQNFYEETGRKLVSHKKLAKDVYLSTYSENAAVFNYSDTVFSYGSLNVPQGEYLIVKGGAEQ